MDEKLTRAQRARLGPVLDATTKKAVKDDIASPFLPIPVQAEYNGKIYSALYRVQDVRTEAYETYTFEDQMQYAGSFYGKIMDDAGKQRPIAEIVRILDKDEFEAFVRMKNIDAPRGARIAAFGGHVDYWNVPNEVGDDVADFSLAAFEQNDGVYISFLLAFERAFLKSQQKVGAATETSPAPSSTTGDTPSMQGEISSQITASEESPGGTPTSSSPKSTPEKLEASA